jgi:dsRNA-specific ribonuclease
LGLLNVIRTANSLTSTDLEINEKNLISNSCGKVLADVLEAIIGAIYIDTGLDLVVTKKIVLQLIDF